MEISAQLVKELRDSSGAGMMDAKKALMACKGNMEEAVDWLRAKGLSKAAKKSDRVASDGLIGVYRDETGAVAVEINSETDFVAKNGDFQRMVSSITSAAINAENLEDLLNKDINGSTVQDIITNHIATIGENLSLRRMIKFSGKDIATYIHNSVGEGLGRLAVLVSFEGGNFDLARQVAMHIAASNPIAISEEDIDPAVLEREKNIFIQQAKDSGKPDNIIESMVNGRLKKYFEEVVLLKQKFVIDPEITVKEALEKQNLKVVNFKRISVGEGIEKEQENFADEVAKTMGS